MTPWVRVVAVVVLVVFATLLLKVLPPVLVFGLFVAGLSYGAALFRRADRAERARRGTGAEILGLRRETSDPFGLVSYPVQLFDRTTDPSIDELVWGTWRGLEVRVFGTSFRAPSLSTDDETRTSFAGAISTLPADVPSVVIEPQAFVMAFERPPALDRVDVGDPAFDDVWSVWASDPAFARTVVGEEVREWLGALRERWAIELTARLAMIYGPRSEHADVVEVLETLKGFLDRLPQDLRSSSPPAV